jgi:glycosyltransferase involved in cell wall biosynthesis
VSPYFAEGFNLQPLECLSTGTTVILPETGSTEEYVSKVMKVSPDSVIQLPSKVILNDNKYQNELQLDDLLNCIINYTKPTEKYDELRNIIERELSWDCVSKQLHDLFEEIVQEFQI